ncbi:hypothetical protein O9H85_27010 [Paenibacillus filicis]|uniref:PRD domain-containing protein n=1 Tax=Paenibacillus gyeongsangnamensis TaxID=3388067 RepID=A0ABT4QGH8_9BACL|nr:hypothetical protein [Paenibacillus filicis]MCZ8515986.1 hypothetical protein [Paenibacillus filicis]
MRCRTVFSAGLGIKLGRFRSDVPQAILEETERLAFSLTDEHLMKVEEGLFHQATEIITYHVDLIYKKYTDQTVPSHNPKGEPHVEAAYQTSANRYDERDG